MMTQSFLAGRLATLLCALSLCACRGEAQSGEGATRPTAQGTAASKPSLSVVRADREDLLFIYQDEEGAERRAMSVAEVPEGRRAQVQVVDLSRSPAERSASGYLQVFDLRVADTEGGYKGKLVSRAQIDQALASAQALPAQPPIVLYTTSWCGVCKKARRFMSEQGWAFVEKDIEKDKGAKQELEQKARRAQVPLRGVPVIDVGGRLMSGFDQASLVEWVTGS